MKVRRAGSCVAALEIGGAHLGVGQQLAAGAAQAHPAVGQHVAPIGKPQRVEGVLLDQEDGDRPPRGRSGGSPRRSAARSAVRARATARRAAAARGRLISARAMASICCSPPDSVPPRWSRRSASRGNIVKTRSRSCSKCAGSAKRGAHLQILEHGHAREDAPALGHLRDAAPDDLVGRRAPVMSSPSSRTAPEPRAGIAANGHQQRRFAGAVGADQGDDLALGDLEVDAVQRLDGAVEGGDAANGEHRRVSHRAPPRRCRDRRGSRRDRAARRPACPRRSCGRSRARRHGWRCS